MSRPRAYTKPCRAGPQLGATAVLAYNVAEEGVKVWEKLTDELLRRLDSIADVADLGRFSFRTGDTAAGSTRRPNLTEDAIEESLESAFVYETRVPLRFNLPGICYQIQFSCPLDWASRDVDNVTALPMYVPTASFRESRPFMETDIPMQRRRDAVELAQPDYIVVSIGCPITDSVYGSQRSIDYQPMTLGRTPQFWAWARA
ncbi:hypothetical protein SCUP234_04821 [Seiridium cupressi]